MRWMLFVVMGISLSMLAYASGSKVDPEDYIDLGTLIIAKDNHIPEFTLSYVKPEGIGTILNPERVSLFIEELVVDGKKVRSGGSNWGMADEMYDRIRDESVPLEEENRTIDMRWFEYGEDYKIYYDRISYQIYAYGRYQNSRTYHIDYGAREVFMTYSILYPGVNDTRWKSFKRVPDGVNQKYYVKWTLEWEPIGGE